MPKHRNPALDITKGVLVLLMILYHWTNYFIGVQGEIYKYLRFITPSFIFISGFIITNVYAEKYGVQDTQVHWRLIQRGAKLLALFTVLNIAALCVLSRGYPDVIENLRAFVANAPSVYLTGTRQETVFAVLVPISYVLVLSPAVLVLNRRGSWSIWLLCIVVLLVVAAIQHNGSGSPNLELISFGLLGMAAGCIPFEKIDAATTNGAAVLVVYLIYTGAIALWSATYLLQLIGVCVNVLAIYALSRRNRSDIVEDCIGLIGQYSLFAYIFHIGLLQVLQRVPSYRYKAGISLIATIMCTWGTIVALKKLREMSRHGDRAYRAVFA